MTFRIKRPVLALCGAGMLFIAGCGGDSDDGTAVVPVAPASTTTNVSTTVIDGALKNALVCMDVNGNGVCDSTEVQGRTDVNGAVTLAVPNGDVGKYPLLAVVGTDATDAVAGPVTVAYALSTPADHTGVVSPLTTLVQQTITSGGATSAEAAKTVQAATGISASLFDDYTKAAAPTDGTISAATVARMLVVTTQQQATQIGTSVVGTKTVDGTTTISQADIDKAIQKKLLELLPALVTALSDPAVLAATSATDKEAALQAAAAALVSTSGLTTASIPTVVAINDQTSVSTPVTATAAAPTISLGILNYTNASNYFARYYAASTAQNTPDASNNLRYVDRRVQAVGGNLSRWGTGSNALRESDLHWNGSAWIACPINFENTSSVRDSLGNSTFNFCDQFETGKSTRATFDVSGKAMTDVYSQARAAGFTSLFVADPTALGSAVFPANSQVFYQASTGLTEAIAYYPAGAYSAPGTSNIVSHYSAAVSAGGDASTAAGAACNSAETATNGVNTVSLVDLIASKTGTPCKFAQGSFVYNGVTYTSDPVNEWWSQSTVNIGKIGSAPVGSGVAPGYFTGNTLLRAAFTGTGTNPVTYYTCKERFNNGSARNCTPIGTGTYTITTLGDAKVMTLSNPPVQTASLNYNRVFVERGGFVYLGYQNKPATTTAARLNTTAATAFLKQLGVTIDDPSVPFTLTAGSYQGTWDINQVGATTGGSTFFINSNGSTSCQDRTDLTFYACTLTITDPVSGAFTLTDDSSSVVGTFNFMNGTVAGTFHDSTSTPSDGNFIGGRR